MTNHIGSGLKTLGVVLLDMIVCYACNLEAQKLGLETDEVRQSSVTEHRIHVIESLDTELSEPTTVNY
jgi:hypothetical protein